jgi:hypothetical protein
MFQDNLLIHYHRILPYLPYLVAACLVSEGSSLIFKPAPIPSSIFPPWILEASSYSNFVLKCIVLFLTYLLLFDDSHTHTHTHTLFILRVPLENFPGADTHFIICT